MKVCIVSMSAPEQMETFVRAHVEMLPFEISYLYGHELNLGLNGRSLRERFESRQRTVRYRSLDLLPRAVEFRLRSRMFPRPDDATLVADYLRESQVDVVLAEYGTTAASMTSPCKMAGIPLVAHFHGFDASRRRTLDTFRDRYRDMFSYATKIIVVSHAMHEQVASLGCSEDKLVLSHCGPKSAFFDVVPDYTSDVIVAVGRLTNKKAPHLLLLAFHKARERCPNLRLHILGDGSLRGVCEDLIQVLGLSESVTLEGVSSPEAIRARMGQSFLFVQHSVVATDGDSEGTPVAILEAAAAGLPVVSTLHAGISDVVVNGDTGILVAERDVQGMADAIIELSADRHRVEALGKAARRCVATHFTMEKHIQTVAATLEGSIRTHIRAI